MPQSKTARFAIALAAILLGFGMWSALRPPAPPVPIPPNLGQLDGQLREYVQEKVNWTRRRPRNADRHALLGLVYASNGLWAEARLAFENALRLKPDQPLALMYAGIASQELGETEAPIRIFTQLKTRFPEFAPGYYRLGTALLRAGKVDEAEPIFLRLTELAPQEWRGYAGVGEIRVRKGKSSEAVELLEKAVRLDPTAKSAHHLLGEAYRAMGDTEKAQLELALGRNAVSYPMPDDWSKDAPAHMKTLQDQLQIADELAAAGEARKAVEVLAKAYVYRPDNVSLHNQLAIALNRSNQPNKAYKLLQQALQKDPRSVPVLITLSFVENKLGLTNQALATAERAVSLAPTIAQTHVAKANVLLGMERDDEALEALRTAAKVDPQNAEVPLEIGDLLWRNLDRPADAKREYDTAQKLNPALPGTYLRLIALNLEFGAPAEAKLNLAKLKRVAPDAPELTVLEKRVRDVAGGSQ